MSKKKKKKKHIPCDKKEKVKHLSCDKREAVCMDSWRGEGGQHFLGGGGGGGGWKKLVNTETWSQCIFLVFGSREKSVMTSVRPSGHRWIAS